MSTDDVQYPLFTTREAFVCGEPLVSVISTSHLRPSWIDSHSDESKTRSRSRQHTQRRLTKCGGHELYATSIRLRLKPSPVLNCQARLHKDRFHGLSASRRRSIFSLCLVSYYSSLILAPILAFMDAIAKLNHRAIHQSTAYLSLLQSL